MAELDPEVTDGITKAIIDSVARSTNAEFKYDVALSGEVDPLSTVKLFAPSRSVLLNLLLGEENFGVPVGKVTEIFGDFSHGKSTIAQLMMNAVQESNGISCLLDSESGWHKDHAIAIGHDPTRHMALEIDTVEEAFKSIKVTGKKFLDLCSGNVPIIYVWDTLAASPTEDEKGEKKERMANKAAIIRAGLRVQVRYLPKVPASLVLVNQTIDKLGGQVKGKTTPGGGGPKFYSSQRLKVYKVGKPILDPVTKRDIGFRACVKAVKNKLSSPNKEVDIPILYDSGVSQFMEVMNYLLDFTTVVNLSGAYKRVENFPEEGKYISFYDKDALATAEAYPALYPYLVEETKKHWLGLT